MRRQYKQRKQFSANEPDLRRLVDPLNTTWSWLWRGEGLEFLPRSRRTSKKNNHDKTEIRRERHRVLTHVRSEEGGQVISGIVQAGSFFEASQALDTMKVPLDPNYPSDAQSAFIVRGSSVNNVADDGDCLIVTAIESEPMLGQLVIVSRSKAGLVETTARRFDVVDKHVELTFASSDPLYRDQEPMRLPAFTLKTKVDDTDIELRGVVVSLYRQV